MTNTEISAIKELLGKPRKIVIIPHYSPDGDAIGSTLGLCHLLSKMGHDAVVISPNEFADFLKWMPGSGKIIDYKAKEGLARKHIKEAEVIFCLDFNHLDRIDVVKQPVSDSTAIKIMIDHHPQPSDFADYMLSDTAACSTAELVYDFSEMLDKKDLIDNDIADCLYAGIMTDTGSFRFNSTTSKTHRIAAFLIDKGARNAKIHQFIFDNFSHHRLQLLGYCLQEKLIYLPEFNTAYFSLSKQEMEKHHFQPGDTEGLVNYGLSIKGVCFAALFTEKDKLVKMSFRSIGDFSVNQFARDHFEGGGHRNAAGGKSGLSLTETLQKFRNLLPQYKDDLKC